MFRLFLTIFMALSGFGGFSTGMGTNNPFSHALMGSSAGTSVFAASSVHQDSVQPVMFGWSGNQQALSHMQNVRFGW